VLATVMRRATLHHMLHKDGKGNGKDLRMSRVPHTGNVMVATGKLPIDLTL